MGLHSVIYGCYIGFYKESMGVVPPAMMEMEHEDPKWKTARCIAPPLDRM